MHPRPAAVARIVVCLAVCLFGGAARASAAGCTVSTTPVVFGTYNVFSTAPTDSTGTIVYRCNGNVDGVLITITRGQSATFLPRQMNKGSEKFSYNLYRDAARSSVWGDYSSGTSGLIDLRIPHNQNQSATIYGRIPAQQDISAGSYADTVSVVVNF